MSTRGLKRQWDCDSCCTLCNSSNSIVYHGSSEGPESLERRRQAHMTGKVLASAVG